MTDIMETDSGDRYRLLAPLYDGLTAPFLWSVRSNIRRIVQECGYHTVLDVCCGTGRMAMMLHGSGFSVSAVDLSPSMLARARRNSPPGIRYFLEDAARLHFQTASFDCAIISFALHEMNPSKRMHVLAETSRVTRKGGAIIVADYIRPRGMLANGFQAVVNIVERIAGKDHHANYVTFVREGGLEPLAAGLGMKLTVRRRTFMDNAAVMVIEANGNPRTLI